jgi:hypothetical protein
MNARTSLGSSAADTTEVEASESLPDPDEAPS